MQHLKDDMEDLFRRAADNYPLKTDNPDWEAIEKKLSTAKDVLNKSLPERNNKRHLLWLLLFIPIGLTYKYFESNKNSTVSNESNSEKNAINNKPDKLNNTISINKTAVVTPAYNEPGKISPAQRQVSYKRNTNKVVAPINHPAEVNTDNMLMEKKNFTITKKQENNIIEDTRINNKEENIQVVEEPTIVDTSIITQPYKLNASQRKKTKKENGFYVGVLISPDISAVKFQSIKKIGVSIGVLAGYQVNKTISVESGALWDVKNYYSHGKHFSTSNIRMPATAKIHSVEGVCSMIEVPLMVRYKFQNRENILSLAVGGSTYFMKEEKYRYDIENNGQQYYYSSTYNRRSTNFFAVANVAVAYDRRLNKNINLRIEPYIKIPIKEMGVGSMPIMSTGINIGIIKKNL